MELFEYNGSAYYANLLQLVLCLSENAKHLTARDKHDLDFLKAMASNEEEKLLKDKEMKPHLKSHIILLLS